jgi:farnesyl diphosphate synthase
MINEKIARYVTEHENFLHAFVSSADIPAPRIKEAMLYTLFPGGKRLRPVLVYLCGAITQVNSSCLNPIAAAVELIHCYSLVHDDLPAMDNDDLRRGRLSSHKAFDEATAILVGDGMQALAIDILLNELPKFIKPSQVIAVTHELVKASGPTGMVSGQSLDLSELAHSSVSESKLRLIHGLKTGKLISACFNMVLAASECSSNTTKVLRDFACHLGLVFQMQDDYLDLYAEKAILGKGRASDEANQKLTFARLYSKRELFTLIQESFQQTKDSLLPLGAQADDLRQLTEYLEKRSHF